MTPLEKKAFDILERIFYRFEYDKILGNRINCIVCGKVLDDKGLKLPDTFNEKHSKNCLYVRWMNEYRMKEVLDEL